MKIFLSILVLIFSCNLTFAHSCATWSRQSDKEHSKKLQETKVIFYGEIISITENATVGSNNFYYHFVNFKVLRAWKGVESNITTALFVNPNPCGIALEVGKKYMVYSYDAKTPFEIDCCSFGLFDDERMKREYGEGKVFEEPQIKQTQPSEDNESFWSAVWQKIISFFS